MFLTAHATVGALLGETVGNPAAAFALGFLSHFFVDLIPHGDEHIADAPTPRARIQKLFAITAIDLLATSGVVFWLLMTRSIEYPFALVAGAVGAMAPDGLQGITELTHGRWLARYRSFHHGFHIANHPRWRYIVMPFSVGLPLQIVFTLTVQRFVGT